MMVVLVIIMVSLEDRRRRRIKGANHPAEAVKEYLPRDRQPTCKWLVS